MSGKKKIWVALAMLLASALIMLLFCGSSPLYPTNPWGDANCFHTMARGMQDGKLLYRDLVEQKGTVLFFLHWLAVLISPNSFFGIFLLEVLALAAFMYISWRTVALFARENSWIWVILAGFLIVTTRAFVWGDSVEELCAPLMAWSFYDAMRYFTSTERRMTNACLLRNGLLAGCVMWSKYSLLGLHFAWMAVIAIEYLIRERKLARAVVMCLVFLAGMAVPTVISIGYFAGHGALADLWDAYVTLNTVGYQTDVNPLLNCAVGLFGGTLVNPLPGSMMVAGVLYLLFSRKGKENRWCKICLVSMIVCAAFLVYCGGRRNGYYYLVLMSFVPLGCIPMARLWDRVRAIGWKSVAGVVLAGIVAVYCGGAVLLNRNLPYLGFPEEELAQVEFAEVVSETENPTMLNCGFLDSGFYLASGAEPVNRWYHTMLTSRDRCFADQSAVIENGLVDYVVTMSNTLVDLGINDSLYEIVAQAEEKMNYNTLGNTYYLYRKIGLCA